MEFLHMFQPFFDFIEKFATDFSWRRLIIFFSLTIIVGFIYFMFELQTATSQLSKYERTIAILEKTQTIKSDNEQIIHVVENIHKGLGEITAKNPTELGVEISISKEFKQALVAGALWGLMSLFFIPALIKKTRDDALSIVGGCLFLACATGLGGYFLPTNWSGWIVFGLYPVGVNLLLFVFFAYLGNKD
jgi:hypothetical protein